MHVGKYSLSPPALEELAEKLKGPLADNYELTSVTVVSCPDLRKEPYHLATEGLSGEEKIADVGGQPNLFPRPRLDCHWSMVDLAKAMDMNPRKGGLLGAGAGPFHVVGQNCELAPNLSWQNGFEGVDNQSRIAQIGRSDGAVSVIKSPSLDCGLMVNLYGSLGEPGPVLKVTASKRKGPEKSFTECIQKGFAAAYGKSEMISLGGVFVVKTGKALYHVMPDFPPEEELPFQNREQVNDWLTYHNFGAPMVCLCVMHSADPEQLGLRMEHTHCFDSTGANAGGHYHYESDGTDEAVEYEGYFNTAKMLYRVDKPQTS